MPEIDPVSLRLFVEDGQARTALARYESVADSAFKKVERGAVGVERALSRFSGALAGVSALALAKQFLDIADTAKSLDAQLRLATAGFGSFAQAQEDVRRVAAQTRSDLTDTGELYGSFARTAKEIGASQMEAAQGTETFSKALKIGGAGTAQVQSATLQLGQALASTNVQWEELGQILEASPRLAKVFTDSLGVTRQQLKQMASDGKLSGEMLFNALNDKKITKGIDAEFAQLPVTFEQAMTQVSNAAVITFGAFDRGGQFSTALANFITQGTGGFEDLEKDAYELGLSIRSSLEGLGNVFDPLLQSARSVFGQIANEASAVGGVLNRLLAQRAGVDPKGAGFGVSGLAYNIDLATGLALRGTGVKGTNLLGRYQTEQQKVERRLRGEQAESEFNDRVKQFFNRDGTPVRPVSRPAALASGGGKKKTGGARSAEAAARKAENERLKAIRDDAANARESAQLQDDINAARAALAVAADDVLKFNLADIESQRNQRIAEYQTQQKLGRLSEKELTDRTAAVNEIADLQRQRVQQIADEANLRDQLDRDKANNQNQQDLYRADAELTASRQERYAIDLRLVQLAYEQERAELEAVAASQTATQAQKDIAEARLAVLGRLQDAAERSVDRQYESPLEAKRREVRETTANMGDRIEDIQVDALDRLTDGLANAATEYVKLGGIAGDVINSIIRDLVKLAAQQAILGGGGVGGLLGLLGGGSKLSGVNYGAISNAANNVKLPGFATGGYTGSGPSSQVAGLVHKGEYVFDAQAVQRIGVQNLAALSNARAAASMAGVTAAGVGARPVQQTFVVKVEANDYFDARVDQRASGIAVPASIAASENARQSAGSDAARQARRRIPGR